MPRTNAKAQYKQEFIERVRLARASTDMRQEDVAEAMNIKQDEYKHWEILGPKGRVIPHHRIDQFCAACEVDTVWLITGRGRMKIVKQRAAG